MTLHIKLMLRIFVFLRFSQGFLLKRELHENTDKERGLRSSGDYFKALMKREEVLMDHSNLFHNS